MKIVAEFNSIKEIKEFAELISASKTETTVLDARVSVLETNQIVQEATESVEPKKEIQETSSEPEKVKEIVPEKEENIPEPKPVQEVEPEEKQLTKDDIRGIFSKLIQAGKQKEAKQLTNKYGAKKISDLKQEDYSVIYKEAEELINE